MPTAPSQNPSSPAGLPSLQGSAHLFPPPGMPPPPIASAFYSLLEALLNLRDLGYIPGQINPLFFCAPKILYKEVVSWCLYVSLRAGITCTHLCTSKDLSKVKSIPVPCLTPLLLGNTSSKRPAKGWVLPLLSTPDALPPDTSLQKKPIPEVIRSPMRGPLLALGSSLNSRTHWSLSASPLHTISHSASSSTHPGHTKLLCVSLFHLTFFPLLGMLAPTP